MLGTYFINFRQLNDHLFGKELFIRFATRAFRKLPSVYVFSYFPFGFEGRMWDLIVSVPDHCLSFYFTWYHGPIKRFSRYLVHKAALLYKMPKPGRDLILPNIYRFLPNVNQVIYTLDTINMPNIMTLAQGVLKIYEQAQGSPGVGRNTFLSSPHLCFIIVFICDLFVLPWRSIDELDCISSWSLLIFLLWFKVSFSIVKSAEWRETLITFEIIAIR